MRQTLLVLAAALTLTACGSNSTTTTASKPTATTSKLPDGSAVTAQQSAYLDSVKPSLTGDHATDVMDTLRLGNDVCRLGMADRWYISAMQSQEGYNLTEATAIVHQAKAHLCG